ncbi:MAG: CrcB family protein [Candidatus Dormibacteria bacterium]
MRTIAGIMIAGSVGAAARYGVDGVVSQHFHGAFPWGTLVVNVTASLLLGIVFTVTTERAVIDAPLRFALTTGFIGSYSTFSTLMLESARLVEGASYGLALLNTGGSLVAGMVAVAVGIVVGRAL